MMPGSSEARAEGMVSSGYPNHARFSHCTRFTCNGGHVLLDWTAAVRHPPPPNPQQVILYCVHCEQLCAPTYASVA